MSWVAEIRERVARQRPIHWGDAARLVSEVLRLRARLELAEIGERSSRELELECQRLRRELREARGG